MATQIIAQESSLSTPSVTGLIPVPLPPSPGPAEVVAASLVELVNDQVPKRVSSLIVAWETLWENPRATPQEIFDALHARQPGSGALVLLAGSLCVQDLENIANAIGATFEELVGESKYYTTKIPFTLNQDGSITLQEV